MSKVLLLDDHSLVDSAFRLLLRYEGLITVFDGNGFLAGYQTALKQRPDHHFRSQVRERKGLAVIKRIRPHEVKPEHSCI